MGPPSCPNLRNESLFGCVELGVSCFASSPVHPLGPLSRRIMKAGQMSDCVKRDGWTESGFGLLVGYAQRDEWGWAFVLCPLLVEATGGRGAMLVGANRIAGPAHLPLHWRQTSGLPHDGIPMAGLCWVCSTVHRASESQTTFCSVEVFHSTSFLQTSNHMQTSKTQGQTHVLHIVMLSPLCLEIICWIMMPQGLTSHPLISSHSQLNG